MNMSSPLIAKLDDRLQQYLKGVDLTTFSRIDNDRLAERAVPNIGLIELVTGDAFADAYDSLYISMFPKRAERERSDLIVERLHKEYAHQRDELARYHLVGIRDQAGAAIGAAHFSVLRLSGSDLAAPYLQYIYVRPENRRQDMSEVLHTIVLAVTSADAVSEKRQVLFTVFETDPPGHGHDVVSRTYAHERASIHMRGGALAMMLRKRGDNSILSPHVQPGLEVGEPPVSLVWVIRPSPAMEQPYEANEIGPSLIAAVFESLRNEGFPEENIQLAERMVQERCQDADFIMLPLSDVATTGD